MEYYERIYKIFKNLINRLYESEETTEEQKSLIEDLLKYMNNIERWYKEDEE